ncbi:MAG: hypothetical protein PWQ49_361 [Methanohalophilus sp.]|nr:hypothetical protein [Methanohalophilus sp.]
MMEALTFGIPVISFPDKDHAEQQNNAHGLEKQECGFRMNYDASAEEVLYRIRYAIAGKLAGPKKFATLASELEGATRLRKIMEHLADDQII